MQQDQGPDAERYNRINILTDLKKQENRMAHNQRIIDHQTSQVTPPQLIPRNLVIPAHQQELIRIKQVSIHRITSDSPWKARQNQTDTLLHAFCRKLWSELSLRVLENSARGQI